MTIPDGRAVAPLRSGQVWVVGQGYATGSNARGGVTSRWLESDGVYDQNPEAILVAQPLDGARHPANIVVGTTLGNITGIVDYDVRYRSDCYLWRC